MSAALHVTLFMFAALANTVWTPNVELSRPRATADQQTRDVRNIVFVAPELPQVGGGGGGGGNQQRGPIRRAQGVGSDAVTLRVQKALPTPTPVPAASPPHIEPGAALASFVIDAKPLASALCEQIGLPNGGVLSGRSTGPGSGGGVGSGIGTGIGSGRGPGLGPGTGGGTGGGAYRPGGAVSGPRLI